MTECTVFLKNYQPPAYTIEKVDLAIDLFDDHARVKNHMVIKSKAFEVLNLYGKNLTLVGIMLDGQLLSASDFQLDDSTLLLTLPADECELTIVTDIKPQDNTELSGLYRSNQLFCTQCEAEGFRRITFFPDRPDVLSRYTTTITADKHQYPILLSNGNLIDQGMLDNGRHWVVWDDPFKKPCYLFALVAGNLAVCTQAFVTCSGKVVKLEIYVEPGNENKCAYAMQSIENAMRWDEQMYGREYDLDVFMIVAVSSFNMGAMENKGLNIFNTKYILTSIETATDSDFVAVEAVVGHEYFHNWTGNRVTCRDWFQLSLKEGLTVFREQCFSHDMQASDVSRILDVKQLKSSQFPEDAGSMAHPVRPLSYQEINNFYTATIYNKGAEVIRMQQALLGKQGFRQGMDLYFERHDGQAVTIEDFVAAMQDANNVDFSQFMHWYTQAGTPVVTVTSNYDLDTLTLTLVLSQTCRPTAECQEKQPFHIPIKFALFDPQGRIISLPYEVLELREKEQTFTFTGIADKPVISLLRDFSAPIKLINPLSCADLLHLLRYETDGFAKWQAAQQLACECIISWLTLPLVEWKIAPQLVSAFRYVLQDNLDLALRNELLMPPGFEDIANLLACVEVDKIEAARDHYRRSLGRALFIAFNATYQTLWAQENNAVHAEAFAKRKLKNLCLWYMMGADEIFTLPFVENQFTKAQNMTDQLASLRLLNNCHRNDISRQAMVKFYEQWLDDELVLDKWFALHASCERPDTLDNVKSLLAHANFSLINPNKVRALIGTFCHANPRHFHANDGSGYVFLTDMIIKLDAINPQIAARLATAYTVWQRYNKTHQTMIIAELKRLAQLPLSGDVTEIITKSLAVDQSIPN